MSEMSPEARALLDSAIPGLEPDGDVRARVRAGVAARIAVSIAAGAAVAAASKSTVGATAAAAGAGATAASAAGVAGAGVGAGAGAATAGAAVTIGVTTKVIASLAVVSAVSVGTITYTQTKKAETRATTTMVAAPTSTPAPVIAPRKTTASAAGADAVDPVAPPNVAPVPDPSIPVIAVAPNSAPLIPTPPILPPPASSATLAAEVSLLRQANAEIAAGNPLKALALLDDHRRLYPRGALVEERDAARVLALCGAGRHSEGIAARSRFLREHSSSPQAPRVQNACATPGSGIQRDFPQ